MPRLYIEDIEKEFSRGKFRPIYIIVGAEHHLVFEALSLVRKAVEGAGADPLSFQSIPGREVRAEVCRAWGLGWVMVVVRAGGA